MTQQRPGGRQRIVAARADRQDPVFGLDHVAGAREQQRALLVGDDQQGLEPAVATIQPPVLGQLDAGPREVAADGRRAWPRAGRTSVRPSAAEPAKPAERSCRCASVRTLLALALTMVLPIDTWPSAPSATLPSRRTHKTVVERIGAPGSAPSRGSSGHAAGVYAPRRLYGGAALAYHRAREHSPDAATPRRARLGRRQQPAGVDRRPRPRSSSRAPVVLVISNRAYAGALARAEATTDPRASTSAVASTPTPTRGCSSCCASTASTWSCSRVGSSLSTRACSRRYPGRVVNIHPGPLPALRRQGHVRRPRARGRARGRGRARSGPTVHLVNERYDEGRSSRTSRSRSNLVTHPKPCRNGCLARSTRCFGGCVRDQFCPPVPA